MSISLFLQYFIKHESKFIFIQTALMFIHFYSISKTFSFRQFSDDKQSTHTHTQGLH